MSSNSSSNSGSCSYATCFYGEVAAMRVSRTEKNPGRRFIGCKNFGNMDAIFSIGLIRRDLWPKGYKPIIVKRRACIAKMKIGGQLLKELRN
ncbi:hypothetical protein LguiA_027572 [Lonicera macranthoides]